MGWQIKGESGATLNATLRDLDALRVRDWTLKFQSLADDTLVWTAEADDAAGTGTIVPDAGQVVELWKDGARIFKGHVGKPQVGLRTVSVTAYGPWWWMQRIALSGENADGEGTVAERGSYVFPTQGLKTSIESLIDRMIAKAVPIARGTVHGMFQVPKITLSNMSFGSALAELMRWCPDSVAWFDYSGTTPELNIYRRGDMTALSYTIGSDRIEDVAINPRLDLEVARVELKYVTRNATTGRPKWAALNDGTAAPGKRQIITVSGPEIVAYLPKDDFESVQVETITSLSTYAEKTDATLAALRKEYGALPGGVASQVTTYSGQTGSGYYGVPTTYKFPGTTYLRDDGTYISSAGKYIVKTGALPEWAAKLLGAINVTVSGTWIAEWKDSVYGDRGWSDAFIAMRGGAATGRGWERAPVSNSDIPPSKDWLARPWSFQAVMINTELLTKTTYYKPWDYDYLSPPSNLAETLLNAQNWVPWEGTVTLVGDDVSGYNGVRRKVNILGGYPAHATMGALVKSVTYQPMRGRWTYELGAPARADFGTMVSRVRRDPSDNIVYL